MRPASSDRYVAELIPKLVQETRAGQVHWRALGPEMANTVAHGAGVTVSGNPISIGTSVVVTVANPPTEPRRTVIFRPADPDYTSAFELLKITRGP